MGYARGAVVDFGEGGAAVWSTTAPYVSKILLKRKIHSIVIDLRAWGRTSPLQRLLIKLYLPFLQQSVYQIKQGLLIR